MESPRERVTSLPPIEGRQVLRPGIRIISQHFDPEPHPDVLTEEDEARLVGQLLEAALKRTLEAKMNRAAIEFSTGMQRMMEAAAELERASESARRVFTIPAGSPVYMGEKLIGFFSDETSTITSSDHRPIRAKIKNDRKVKRPAQTEPFYVSKTKRKRR